jgi:predicted SnoaL-like aldol condensation-catalyzing enzyme
MNFKQHNQKQKQIKMAKTIKMENPHAPDSKEGQAALAKEVINENPRKMSEIVADKKEALAKNEDLLRALQQNEYEIPVGKTKLFKQLMKFLEKDAEWGHTTATGLVMLYSNLRESITILWQMITTMKGKGSYEARNFIELMAEMGQDLSTVVGKVHEDNQELRDNHVRLSELDAEVNHPDIILDVAIDEYNKAEDELTQLMDEVDPVVETV